MSQSSMAQRRHELLRDVEERAAELAVDLGFEEADARRVGAAMADLLLENWAGQQITFPMRGFYGLSAQELAIVSDRDRGLRVFELARKYGMTERGIRKLLKRADEGRSRTSAQMDLFSAPGSPTSPQGQP